ncbi:MAG: cation:proton antiporter, partial [Prevotellaceae bacterium]|nr:cation:proton antiporter [Prevotellaceae bacterium]
MPHLPTLISDLALILITAAVTTLIFRKLKQPLVLGYIIAGFLVSPHLGFTPNVADEHSVEIWADIGVIFLLFSLGLEFSFKKLLRVGGSASITAIFEIVCITLLGFLTGKLLNWKTMDCMFLGGMLASSSTTIIIRAFDELGLKSKHYVKTVFGVLVVEDIVVILLMVLLSTVAVTQHVEGIEMSLTVLKLGFFLILWFLMGIFIIPTLLKKTKKLLDDEVYLILSIGLCLGMVFLATKVGFSAELGAFIMGSILAETTSAEKIEHIFKPVKDLFGAIFFVSIGMMINPVVIVNYGWIVLLVTLLVIFGKFIATAVGAVLSGQSLKQAVEVGMSMAQIGEFAFIVATLGMSLGVISDFLFPVAVGASAITTFTTPYMIKYSDNFYKIIEKIVPNRWQEYINAYSSRTDNAKSETETWKLVKNLLIIVVINIILIFSIIILCSKFLLPVLSKSIVGILPATITLIVGLLLSAPFLWALMFKIPNNISSGE